MGGDIGRVIPAETVRAAWAANPAGTPAMWIRDRVRTDSTHVLAAVRKLNRVELVGETLRVALQELAAADEHWLAALITAEWARRYGRPVRYDRLPRGKDVSGSGSSGSRPSRPVRNGGRWGGSGRTRRGGVDDEQLSIGEPGWTS